MELATLVTNSSLLVRHSRQQSEACWHWFLSLYNYLAFRLCAVKVQHVLSTSYTLILHGRYGLCVLETTIKEAFVSFMKSPINTQLISSCNYRFFVCRPFSSRSQTEMTQRNERKRYHRCRKTIWE
jgi:hypothetical protein